MVAFRRPNYESGFYDRRLKIFIGITLGLFAICLLRLLQMQLFTDSSVQAEIAAMKERRGSSQQLKTLRGRILDRHGEIIAADVPRFQVYINYRLTCFLDDRVVRALLAEARRENANPSLYEVYDEIASKRQDLRLIMDRCARFGTGREEIEARIRAINDDLWNLRAFICWARGPRDPNLLAEYGNQVTQVPAAKAMQDFERREPNATVRCLRVAKVDDIPEMEKFEPLVELRTEDDIFAAQLGFMGMDDVQVLPTGQRYYPYGSTAAQTIGWVGSADPDRDNKLFADDPLARYTRDEVCGREDGVEYVCESILRGRRGELVYDIDKQLVRQTETRFGQDVRLTLDIALQKRIEEHISSPQANPDYCSAPTAAVVIHIPSGDILALVSLPSYDLNRARYDYDILRKDVPRRPLINRALNYDLYPAGSVAKPVVLVAALESGAITPDEVISCPAAPAPTGWPNCWIYRQYKSGHDEKWLNNARNAVKGSCNIYFSHVAARVAPRVLQEWFFRFGYGHEIPLYCPAPAAPGTVRRSFRQVPGELGSDLVGPYTDIESFDRIPPLRRRELPMFGIGQGNLRVTPLQVAAAFAALARGGKYAPPRLFLDPNAPRPKPVDLHVSPATLGVLRDGMYAVVNEHGGTAYEAFSTSGLSRQGVKVYGKTGSTERPYDAWFAGYVEDGAGPELAVVVVIEGGQHGGSDAGPLARDIIQMCVEAGYAGHKTPPAGRRE
jgi:penicillin-binding protein 2